MEQMDYAPFELVSLDVEKPIKKPHQIEALLVSHVAWGDMTPLVYMGTNDGHLHAFVPPPPSYAASSTPPLSFLRFHMTYKKIFHPCACFLDSWGVFMTVIDTKLTLYAVPLQTNAELDGNATGSRDNFTSLSSMMSGSIGSQRERVIVMEDTKQCVQFAVQEAAHVVATLSKQQTIKVFDWTVHRVLELRSQIDGNVVMPSIGTIQKLVWMSESHLLVIGKKEWTVLNVDSGKPVEISPEAQSLVANMDVIVCAAAVPSLHSHRNHRENDVLIATKLKAVILTLFSDQKQEQEAVYVRPNSRIEYNVTPSAIYSQYPFVLLDQHDKIAVYNLATMRLMQTLPVKLILAATSVSNIKENDPVASISVILTVTATPQFQVHTLQMQSIATQIQKCLPDRLEDAVTLCRLCPEDTGMNDQQLAQLYHEYALQLFQKQAFEQAITYFRMAKTSVNDVLKLFPSDLLPRNASIRPSNEKSLPKDQLVPALVALVDFLQQKRIVLPNKQSPELQLVDTVLLKTLVLLLETTDHQTMANSSLQALVNEPNACELTDTELFLRSHHQLEVLLAFYQTRKLHRKALELLEDLERSHSDTKYLKTMAAYLQTLDHKRSALVFEFSRRVMAVDPALGLSIFTNRRVPEEKQDVDPYQVLQHLKIIDISSAHEVAEHDESLPLSDSRFLAIEYLLEIILTSKQSVMPKLHDELVYLLLEAIQQELQASSLRLTSRVSAQQGLVGLLRRKLLAFLEFPDAAFHPERMLSRIAVEMLDERAALLSKLGRHHDVLQLYALELKDTTLAEAYCNQCYETNVADASIYSTLLRLYLRPPLPGTAAAPATISASPPAVWRRSSSSVLMPSKEAVAAAVNVMNKYAERMDVATALELLPPDVPVASLSVFFRQVLENQVERLRNGQVQHQLSKMENFKIRELLSIKRKGSVTVWASNFCDVCGKKLGIGTFVRLPSGALLHYACQPATLG